MRVLRIGIFNLIFISIVFLPHFSTVLESVWAQTPPVEGQSAHLPTVNIPYFSGEIRDSQTAIFWFGRVTETENYTDVRVGYDDKELYLLVSVFDKQMWYTNNPKVEELDQWDAVSVYLSPDPAAGGATFSPTRFVSQVRHWQPEAKYKAAWVRTADQWVQQSVAFGAKSSWRGSSPNNNSSDERGWTIAFRIPFTSLGMSGPPVTGSRWKLGVVVHDRDDAGGAPIPDQLWPKNLDRNNPQTWGNLVYGLPAAYIAPTVNNPQTITIRHGLNGAVVPDAEVGGSTICGSGMNFWRDWGNTNYAGRVQFNVQNQTDVADWPCFAKYYIDFPLDQLPAGKTIISASLILHMFGNAGQGWDPGPLGSTIQVFTVKDNWTESTITWNNAPQAHENVSRAWVEPVSKFPGWPGVPYHWDLGHAVAEAQATGGPLRLVLYTAAAAYHSGKYFTSSDAEEWNAKARPTLVVVLGDRIESVTPAPIITTPPTPAPNLGADKKIFLPSIQH